MTDVDKDCMNRIIKIVNDAKPNSTTIEDIMVSYDTFWNMIRMRVTTSDPNHRFDSSGDLVNEDPHQLAGFKDDVIQKMKTSGLPEQFDKYNIQIRLYKPIIEIEFRLDKKYREESDQSYEYLLPKYNKLVKLLRNKNVKCSVYLSVKNGVAKINIDLYRNYSDAESDNARKAAVEAGVKSKEYSIQGSSMGAGGLKNDRGVEEYDVLR